MLRPTLRLWSLIAIVLLTASACSGGPPAGGSQANSSDSASAASNQPAASDDPSPSTTDSPLATLRGTILFTRAGGEFGDETIFTADADGRHERRVVAETCCPRWSWDGSRILVAALADDGQRITTGVIQPDGSPVTKVPLPEGGLNLGPGTWAHDGQHMVLDGFGTDEGLYLAAIDGSSLVRLTDTRAQTVDLTPEDDWVVFFEGVPGFPMIGNQQGGSLFRVRADGTGRERITPDDLPVENIGGQTARISHDGASLVFPSNGVIWRIGVDGTVPEMVYEDPDGRIAITPTWSPEDDWILFGLDPAGSLATVDEAPPNVLAIVRPDGTEYTEVITSRDWKREPDWTSAGD